MASCAGAPGTRSGRAAAPRERASMDRAVRRSRRRRLRRVPRRKNGAWQPGVEILGAVATRTGRSRRHRSRCARCRATSTAIPRPCPTRREDGEPQPGPVRRQEWTKTKVQPGLGRRARHLACPDADKSPVDAVASKSGNACGPGSSTGPSAPRRRPPPRPVDVQRLGRPHPRHDSEGLQPRQLPQRIGLAPRQRPVRSRARPVRAR